MIHTDREEPTTAAGHEPHPGKHTDYACGLSGPHCWMCSEPWPCRASRGITEADARRNDASAIEAAARQQDDSALRLLTALATTRGDSTTMESLQREARQALAALPPSTPPALNQERLARAEAIASGTNGWDWERAMLVAAEYARLQEPVA